VKMAKVTSWGFTRLRGKVKDAEFRERKNKVIELSKKRVPSNPRTDAQKTIRSAYGKCVEKWNKLSYDEKLSWRAIGNSLKMSGYNAYMQDCISKAIGAIWYEITIDNTGNANTLTDYQVLLEISGDAAFFEDCENNQVYLEFYDEDQETLLKHYVEEWDTTNHNAKIWIKVPSIPGSATKTIYLKINTTRTEDLSNGEDTFVFFDDFANLNKWSILSGNWTLQTVDGKTAVFCDNDAGDHVAMKADFSQMENQIIEVEVKASQFGEYREIHLYPSISDMDNRWLERTIWRTNHWEGEWYKKIGGSESEGDINTNWSGMSLDVWYTYKLVQHGDTATLYVDDEEVGSVTEGDVYGTISNAKVGIGTAAIDAYFTNFRVRKYASPEPSVSYTKM